MKKYIIICLIFIIPLFAVERAIAANDQMCLASSIATAMIFRMEVENLIPKNKPLWQQKAVIKKTAIDYIRQQASLTNRQNNAAFVVALRMSKKLLAAKPLGTYEDAYMSARLTCSMFGWKKYAANKKLTEK